MENELPQQVQAVRPISKDSLDSVVDSAPAPKITYFDCLVDSTTKKGFVLWDDIRLAFSDALYVRHQDKVVPFMKGIDFMPLQPLRFAVIPDVVLDIVVDAPLVRTEAAFSQNFAQMTVQDAAKEASIQEEASTNTTTAATITEIKTPLVRRNPAYGLEEAAMQNYNHINNPALGPQPRAPQYIPNSDNNHSIKDAPDSMTSIYDPFADNKDPVNTNTTSIDNRLPQAPQDHAAAAGVKDISPIVMKATLGDANSQVDLGTMYKFGDGVEQDYEAARYWYLKAAKQGDASAQCSVGDLYRLGLGIDFNHVTALSWYQKAADQGNASGQCNLGLMYRYGLAVEMDYAVAMDWYRKSADQGYALAQCSIGEFYLKGHDVPQDYSKAMEWYLLAANQDLSWAHSNVGLLHYNGTGVAKDKDVGLEWLRKATSCRHTDAWAQYIMGFLYLHGLGTPRDYSKASEWFQKSACQGLPEAQHLIAYLYLHGLGVPQDYSEAFKWYRKAADQHIPEAQCNIARMFRLGLGVSKDCSIAKEWYVKAARQGVPHAKRALEELQQSEDKE